MHTPNPFDRAGWPTPRRRATGFVLAALPFVLLALGSCSARPDPLTPAMASADSLVQAAVDEGLIPGAVLLVAREGRTIHERAYGYAQCCDYGGKGLDEPPLMTPAHLFDLASLTKVFATTFGLMLLVDQGKVDLDAPVFTYLPAFRGASKDSVTVRHLLTHTAGLYPWKPLYYHADNPRDTYAYISQLPLAYPVGKARHYSDLGFMLLGYMVEAVGAQPLDGFLATQLYEPLGLTTTTFQPRSKGHTRFAATSRGNPFEYRMVADDSFGYRCDEDPAAFQGWRDYVLVGEVNDGNAYHAHGGVAGHAGLFSTASDLQVLIDLLLGKGVYAGRRILSEAVIDTFLTPDRFGNGLGWAMAADVLGMDALPEGAFGHTGFTGTYAVVVPAYGLNIILFTNRQNVGVNEAGYYPSVTPLRKSITERMIEAVRGAGEGEGG